MVLMTTAMLLLGTLNETTPYWRLSIFAIMLGMGLGFCLQNLVIALQNSLEVRDMGIGTSLNTFWRSIGGTLGVAIFGSIYASKLTHYMGKNFMALGVTPDPAKLAALQKNPAIAKTFPASVQATIDHSYVQAFHIVFYSAAPVTAIGIIVALMLKATPLKTGAQHAQAMKDAAGEALG